MSRYDKILIRITSTPPPSDIKWSKLKSLLIYLGYVRLKPGLTGGSRRKFYHKEKDALIICHKPHPESIVDKGCIKDIAQHLSEHGFV